MAEVTHSVVQSRWLGVALALVRLLPGVPQAVRHHYDPPRTPWDEWDVETPEVLRTVAGIWRDETKAREAFDAGPLPLFPLKFQKEVKWLYRRMARSVLPTLPSMVRALRATAQTATRVPRTAPVGVSGPDLTRQLKELASQQGFAVTGVALYDEKYTFEPYLGQEVGDRMVVLIFEQNWERTQEIPSKASERTVFYHYADMMKLALPIGEFLNAAGYRAHIHDTEGRVVAIHYAVEAGLGQLGLNGQLLTPHAGSRCRLMLINTNAPLSLDQPRDFGVNAVCDQCKACVERCPSGAIPANRREHRGVLKAKINTSRCLPVVAQAHGCAVCMKVCPVQRYGLADVLSHLEETGNILGRHTDELEGYHWPIDGKHYGPSERPHLGKDFFEPGSGLPKQRNPQG